MTHSSKKQKEKFLFFSLISILALSILLIPDLAHANPWQDAGISSTTSSKDAGLFSDLTNIVNFIMVLGGFWILACIVFAGVKLSGAQGNPQNRTQAFVGIGMAFIGGWVILQAYDIAGWIAGFGS